MLVTKAAIAEETNRFVTNAEEITYDWLVHLGKTTGYTDHVPHFKRIFNKLKVNTFLEFGLGFSTKYFLDSCNKVISVEFIHEGYGPEWMQQCLKLYEHCTNWIPIAYFSQFRGNTDWAPFKYQGSDHVSKAGYYQCVTHQNYALIDDSYLKEIHLFMLDLIKLHKIDIGFVDAGIYLRGDLIQILFGKIPVIAAHDTNCRAMGMKDDVYGYSRIITPDNYEEIHIPQGQGMTVWIIKKDQFSELSEDLKNYAKETQ